MIETFHLISYKNHKVFQTSVSILEVQQSLALHLTTTEDVFEIYYSLKECY